MTNGKRLMTIEQANTYAHLLYTNEPTVQNSSEFFNALEAPQKWIPTRKVITLCGSTKFKDEFILQMKRLTLENNIVISVGLFGHSGDNEVWTDDKKQMLDDMHKEKISMSDEIFVINVGGYIGTSTRSEIDYAILNGKAVRYLEPIPTPYNEKGG